MGAATRILLCLPFFISAAAIVKADTVERSLTVTFVSADLVYLNGGRAEGLSVGAKPVVYREDQRVTELEVLHLAEHSSACRFAGPVTTVTIGDIARLTVELKSSAELPAEAADSQGTASDPSTSEPVRIEPERSGHAIHPDASGSIAILYSDWDDHSDAELDFSQARLDIDLRVEPLWTHGLSFTLRTSGRQDRRYTSIDGSSDDSWESRIATLALEYKQEGSRVGLAMGRINPARVGAIGRLDGGSFEYRVSDPVRIGLFMGANSQWQYTENRPSLQTYGAYAGYRKGSARNLLVDQTFSVVGQYHGGTTSRESLFAQGRIARNGRWNLSHSVEVDINRGWREEGSGQVVSLSTAYAQGRLNLTRYVAATLSYDTRKSFRTYETRDIADSIFDDRVRQGVRAQLDVSLPDGIVVSAGAGVRSVANEPDRTVSYNGAVRKQGLFNVKSTVSIQAAAFNSAVNSGHNVNASIGQGIRQRDWITLGAGLYSYSLDGDSAARINRRVDLTVRVGITQSLAVSALGQLNGGDDTRGHRLEAGVSYQF
jgi:hypothetical protein